MCHKCPEHFFQDRNSLKGYPDKVSEAPSTVARFPFLLRQVFWGGSRLPFFSVGRSWSALGRSWCGLGPLLGGLGRSWRVLEAVLGPRGASWDGLRAVSAALGPLLGCSWPLLGVLGVVLGHLWAALGLLFAALGRSWGPRKRFCIGSVSRLGWIWSGCFGKRPGDYET